MGRDYKELGVGLSPAGRRGRQGTELPNSPSLGCLVPPSSDSTSDQFRIATHELGSQDPADGH